MGWGAAPVGSAGFAGSGGGVSAAACVAALAWRWAAAAFCAVPMGQLDRSPLWAAPTAWANSCKLTFMPLRVESVIFCTCSACTVAARALPFWSSQNCTAFNSSMRLSISSTLTVGATQLENGGSAAPLLDWLNCWKKSYPGMNWPKPKACASLMATSCECNRESLMHVSAACHRLCAGQVRRAGAWHGRGRWWFGPGLGRALARGAPGFGPGHF